MENNLQRKSRWSFKLSEDDLQKQVQKYAELNIWQSARGIAALAIGLSTLLTFFIFFVSGTGDITGIWISVALMGVLGFFIYRGSRAAIVIAMIWWTIEKLFQLLGIGATGGGNAVGIIIWWVAYMTAFYHAYQVETERKKIKAT